MLDSSGLLCIELASQRNMYCACYRVNHNRVTQVYSGVAMNPSAIRQPQRYLPPVYDVHARIGRQPCGPSSPTPDHYRIGHAPCLTMVPQLGQTSSSDIAQVR